MAVNRRKKNVKFRGSKTHGYGAMKKHRGAGSRGGRGNAGTGKRSDTKKPSIWKDTEYFGRRGFTPVRRRQDVALTIADLDRHISRWIAEGKVKESSGVVHVSLDALGYTKLLSNGAPSRKYAVTCLRASALAAKKIKAAGGTMTVKEQKEDKDG